MLNYKNRGYTVEINLPKECGYEGYSVECTYKYNKKMGKYALSMWLKRKDIGDKFRIGSQEIDTQYISGNRDTIVDNICRIVDEANRSGFFTYYIHRYEYTYKCFEIGNELYEKGEISVNAS